jgi:hypothetical protein
MNQMSTALQKLKQIFVARETSWIEKIELICTIGVIFSIFLSKHEKHFIISDFLPECRPPYRPGIFGKLACRPFLQPNNRNG